MYETLKRINAAGEDGLHVLAANFIKEHPEYSVEFDNLDFINGHFAAGILSGLARQLGDRSPSAPASPAQTAPVHLQEGTRERFGGSGAGSDGEGGGEERGARQGDIRGGAAMQLAEAMDVDGQAGSQAPSQSADSLELSLLNLATLGEHADIAEDVLVAIGDLGMIFCSVPFQASLLC